MWCILPIFLQNRYILRVLQKLCPSWECGIGAAGKVEAEGISAGIAVKGAF
jgi:hypothetical protein